LFEHKLGLPVPSPDADLFESGVMDSLAFVNMLLQIESEFGLKFSLESIDLERFRSVARIAEVIASEAADAHQGVPSGRHRDNGGNHRAGH
jgi:acyl carrier protein